MRQITGSKKLPHGIQVFWTGDGAEGSALFTYEELIEQEVNALDLVENPRIYQIDPASHAIGLSEQGCGRTECQIPGG